MDILVHIESDKVLDELQLQKGAVCFTTDEQQRRVDEQIRKLNPVISAGGSAANTMKAAAQLGLEATYVGKIGKDDMGRAFSQALREQGVIPVLLETDAAPTGTASTLISPDGQRSFADQLGAATLLQAHEITALPFRNYDALYMEGYLVSDHGFAQAILRQAKADGLLTCLDLASYNIVQEDSAFFRQLLAEEVDIAFANEEESWALTGLPPREAVRKMAGWCSVAVVKTGAQGAMACSGKEIVESAAIPVPKVVDTTGAGDSFAAGFLWAWFDGRTLTACLDAGNAVAAEMIQHIGATLPAEVWTAIRTHIQ